MRALRRWRRCCHRAAGPERPGRAVELHAFRRHTGRAAVAAGRRREGADGRGSAGGEGAPGEDGRPRGLQGCGALDGGGRGPGAGAGRPDRRGHRPAHSAPGEYPHHRGDGTLCERADGEGVRKRGPLRQHELGDGADRARRGRRAGTRQAWRQRSDGRVRCRVHVGFRGDPVVGLLFPGQGSQFVGMGRDLAEASDIARRTFEEADDLLGFALSKLCWDGPEAVLTATNNAQPAILTHSIAAYRVLVEVGELSGDDVHAAAGQSRGGCTAYVAAGAISFEEGLRTVRLRGELMYRAGQERSGAMAAILGLSEEGVDDVCRRASEEGGECVPANATSPHQLVTSGDTGAMELAKEAGARRALRLNVSGAFHSPLMDVAVPGLREQLAHVTIRAPQFPIVSNVTAEPVSDPERARALLLEQLTSAVRWTQGVHGMVAAGVTDFIEIGPGNVLSGLVKRIEKGVHTRTFGTAAELEALT